MFALQDLTEAQWKVSWHVLHCDVWYMARCCVRKHSSQYSVTE